MGPMFLDSLREVALQTGPHMTELSWDFSLTLRLSSGFRRPGGGGIKPGGWEGMNHPGPACWGLGDSQCLWVLEVPLPSC